MNGISYPFHFTTLPQPLKKKGEKKEEPPNFLATILINALLQNSSIRK